MTDTTWTPLPAASEDVADEQPNIPEQTIFNVPLGTMVRIQSIDFVNFHPTAKARRREPRTRQVSLLLALNKRTGLVPVVQPEKAGDNEWSLIQGGIDRNETAFDAVHREAREEAGVTLTDVTYVGSYRAPVGDDSDKKPDFDYQLFHCFVACTSAVEAKPQCDGIAYASMFHQNTVLQTLLTNASSVKQVILPLVFQAAAEHGLLAPAACSR